MDQARITAWLVGACALAVATWAPPAGAEEKVVRVYNWSDYIDEQILKDFTAETGIKVVYDVYDSNDILETKLLAGSTGYDVVVPTNSFLARQVAAGIFLPLDKSKIPNLKNLDPKLMAKVERFDPGNAHGVIYMWGTTGFAYNEDKIRQRDPGAPTTSWKMLFDPGVAGKFKDCGIYMLDQPDDMLPSVLAYLGLDPDSKKQADLEKAAAVLKAVRPDVRKFHSSENINALANGDICLAAIWSGDAGIAKSRAEEAKNGVKVEYEIPDEGALLWFDMMAISKDAPHPDNAHAFINYILRPDVIAKASNVVTYPNAVPASKEFIHDEIKNDPKIYPADEVIAKATVLTPYDARTQKSVTRMWTSIMTGH